MTWPAAEFGDAWAAVYDAAHAHLRRDTTAAVATLRAGLPAGGRVLDLGVGTGRLAIPLAAAGLEVVGVDASPRMLAVLAAKAGGARVEGVLGDMTDPPVHGRFDLVLLAFNTLFSLPDGASQAACLAAAARLLAPAGEVVVDAAIPQPWRLPARGHDPVAQTVRILQHVADGGPLPLSLRYATPAQIDDMATAAGLCRTRRLAGWDADPGEDCVDHHVSTYRAVTPDAPAAANPTVGRWPIPGS